MGTTNIKINGIELELEYNYLPGCLSVCNSYGVPEEPGCDEEFELVEIRVPGTDLPLNSLFTQEAWDSIECCLNKKCEGVCV